jgi:GNAT superfamily N-acetyltransferase
MVMRRTIEEAVAPRLEINPAIPPAGDGVPFLYAMELKAVKPLVHVAPDYDFMDMFDGEITRRQLDRPPEPAGRFLAFRLRVEDAHEAGCPVRMVIEPCGDALLAYWKALFDARTGDLKGWLKENWRLAGSNVLLIYSIALLPEHRGRNVGLATAARLIETLGGGCSLIACRPFAAQFSRPIPDPEFHAAMRLDELTQDRRAALARLRRHWRTLGFRRVARSAVYAMPNDQYR